MNSHDVRFVRLKVQSDMEQNSCWNIMTYMMYVSGLLYDAVQWFCALKRFSVNIVIFVRATVLQSSQILKSIVQNHILQIS